MVFSTNFQWREPSIKDCISLAVVGVQTGLLSLASKGLEDQIHARVIVEHVIQRQVQGTQRHLNHFFFVSKFRLTSALLPGDL